jgi:HlyD family secretion protein
MRTGLIVGVVLAVLVGGWLAYGRMNGGLPVEAAAARRGPISEFIDERGKTRLPRTYLITMPFQGRIEAIDLPEGTPVKQGQAVARIVPLDLSLSLDLAKANVERAEASIVENDDTTVEQTGLQQTLSFVESMEHTVEAAAARVKSGQAKLDYAERTLARMNELRMRSRDVVTDDALNQAELRHVESNVDYQQDVLVHSALVAMKAATDLTPTTVRQYIERKQLTHNVLDAELDQARYRLREAERDHQRGTLTSPIEGVVLDRRVSDERQLPAGEPLLEIGNLADLEIEAEVLTQDVVRIQPGDAVDIYGAAIGPRPVRGRVERIYPAGFTKISSLGVEQQRVKVVVRFDPEDLAQLREERELGVGYRVNVKLYTASKDDALVVPRSALFRGGDGDWQVFAVRDGVARLVNVRVGLINDELAEITDGLAADDIVVLAPETDLQDGVRVKPLVREGRRPADGESDGGIAD